MNAKTKIVIARSKVIVGKLFIWSLGVAFGASVVFVSLEAPKLLEPQKLSFERVVVVEKSVEVADEWVEAEFSAYTASVDETDSSPEIMASGRKVFKGAIACPRHLELGTRVEVEGLGQYVCEDRMNVRYENNFDIYVDTKHEALAFGRKTLKFKIL